MEQPITPEDHIDQFVLVLLRTGLLLTDIAADLSESLPDDAYPGEEPGVVAIEMVRGSIRSVLEDADPDLVTDAADLMELALDRVQEHLCLALRLAELAEQDPSKRGYG